MATTTDETAIVSSTAGPPCLIAPNYCPSFRATHSQFVTLGDNNDAYKAQANPDGLSVPTEMAY